MALSPNAQSALIQGIFSGAGTLGQLLQQNAQNKQQAAEFQQQFQRSAAGDLLAAEPLGSEAAFQTKRRAKQAILQSLIKGGVMPASQGIAEHMPIDSMDYSGLVGPLSDQATIDAIAQRNSDLDLIRNSIQYSGNPAALASRVGGGGGLSTAINTGMTGLNLYKQFGGKLPNISSFFGNAPAATTAASAAGAATNAAKTGAQYLPGVNGTPAGPVTSSFYDSVQPHNTTGVMGALTGGTGSMWGPASKGFGQAVKAGGVGGILGGFGTAMAIRNGQVGNATLSGGLTGLKYGGPIGAAIGAGVGLVGSLFSKHQNKTKGSREDFAKSMGYKDLASFNNYLSTLGPAGQAARTYGETVVGKHNDQQNAQWQQMVQAAINGSSGRARLY